MKNSNIIYLFYIKIKKEYQTNDILFVAPPRFELRPN